MKSVIKRQTLMRQMGCCVKGSWMHQPTLCKDLLCLTVSISSLHQLASDLFYSCSQPTDHLPLLCPSSLWRPQDCHLATILPTLSVLLNVHWQRPIPSPTPSTLSTSPRPELMLNPGHNCCGTNSPTPRVSLLIPQPPQKLSLASDTIP